MTKSLKWLKRSSISVLCILSTSVVALAAGPAGVGSDAWTAYLERENRFTPHENYCDSSTEAFVNMTPEGMGFCIDKNRNASTKTWNDARQTCVMAGKRLPEIPELQHACNRNIPDGLGLVNITGVSWEWGSNFGYPALVPSLSIDGLFVHVFGANSCNAVVTDAGASGSASSDAFRCVR